MVWGNCPMMEVNEDVSIAKGESLDFQDTSGFHFNAGSVFNAGTVNVHGSGDLWDTNLCGGFANGNDWDGLFWNQKSGRFHVTAAAETLAYGYLTVSSGPDFQNDGVFTVKCKDGSAYGVSAQQGMEVVNSGSLLVTAGGSGVGVRLYNGGSFNNSGTLTVRAGDYATGFTFELQDAAVINSGSITAISSTRISHAVELAGGTLDNSGVITGGYSIWAINGAISIENTGSLIGDVMLHGGSNTIHNSGRIVGDISFGAFQDRYDGADGRIIGTVYGELGDDTLTGGGKGDVLYGDGATASKSDGDDLLSGGKGVDHLFGENSRDILIGGAGSDELSGGAGADHFVYLKLSDSTSAHFDTITDLTGDDVIDLSAIDADATLTGDQAFVLVSGFTGQAGQLMLNDLGGDTELLGDVNGDGAADFTVRLSGDQTGFNHFVL